jgi:hypothetical protein
MATKGLTNEELIEKYDQPLTKNEEGMYEFAVYDQESHCIIIKFDKIFNRDSIKQHNIFKIQHKRYYSEGTANSSTKPMLPTICNDINYVMNQNNDSIRSYALFSTKIALKDKKPYELETFKEDVYKFIDDIKVDIVNYVESNYELDLSETNEKINTDLQVTDEMNKIFVESAVAMRIVIPIICDYTLNNKIDGIFYDIFRTIMIKFTQLNEEKNNPLTKLRSVVRSRVEQTKYANKKIWKFISNYTTDMKLICEEFNVQLIESIIPKLDINRSAIKYIDVVLRKKLDFAFTFNFTFEFRPLRNLENDDDTDERDRLNETIFTNRKNEGQLVLNKLTIKQHISQYIYDNDITDDIIDEFKTNVLKNKNLNNIQNYFLFITFGKIFEVNVATEKDRVILLHELIHDLEEDGFIELPKILKSTVENEIDIRNKVGGKKLKSQDGFLKIIKKYEDVVDIIDNDNFIIKMISFKNYRYLDDEDNQIIINPNNYEREVISFILAL